MRRVLRAGFGHVFDPVLGDWLECDRCGMLWADLRDSEEPEEKLICWGPYGRDTYSLVLELPFLPATNPSDRHGRFVQQRTKNEAISMVGWHVKGLEPKEPLKLADGLFVRRSAARPDYDNLCYSMKFVVDGLVRAGILVDDAPRYWLNGHPTYLWAHEPAAKSGGKPRCSVRIIAVD